MLLPILLAALPQAPQAGQTGPQAPIAPTPKPTGTLLVSGFNSGAVHVYDAPTAAFEGLVPSVAGAQSIVRGPDGLLYACAEGANEVLRIDPESLTVVDAFVFDDLLTIPDETGGLAGPTSAVFGPDGNLYVASFNTDAILRYDGATGAFLDVFVASGSGGLDGPDAGTTFGPDGHLYVPSFWNNRVLRFDGRTGASLGTFISAQPSNLSRPRDVKFHEGSVYVASSGNNRVLRYDLAGNSLGIFVTTGTPYSLAFHPGTGNLYVANLGPNRVNLFDGTTGAHIGRPVSSGEGGLDGATWVYLLEP